jgi:hypothetical protein
MRTIITIFIDLLMSAKCYSKTDTLPANRILLTAESNTELSFDMARTFGSDFIVTYKPRLKQFDGAIKPALMGGIYNNKIALGINATSTIYGRYNEKRFGMSTTEGIEAAVGFILTSGKTELYIIPGVYYKVHLYEWIGNYVIISPGLSLWLGTTNFMAINLNLGVGL